MFLLSLPMRERGLKYNGGRGQLSKPLSLPMRGAWIEMLPKRLPPPPSNVAPHAGAWIEIRIKLANEQEQSSFPMRGAWIEILPHRWPGIGNKKALKGAFLFFIYSFLIFRQCSYCLTGRGGRSLRGLWRRGW